MKIKEYTEFKKDEIWQLYTQVGWTAYTENMTALERGYKNSLLVLAAYENEELLGIVRVVGDGATIILVQDILVYPQKQRQGIGTSLLKAVLERYADVRQIQLVTDNTPKTVAFYQSLGFVELEKLGCCGCMEKKSRRSGTDPVVALTLIFVVLKVMGLISWSWLWVLSPIWLTFLLFAAIFSVILVGGRITKGKW